MTFPSITSTTHQQDLALAWQSARQIASDMHDRTVVLNGHLASENVGADAILAHAAYLADCKDRLLAAAAEPGIVDYAQAQLDEPTIDIVVEFDTMITALDAVVAWIVAATPKDGSGFLLVSTLGSNGRQSARMFTPTDTAGLRTLMDALAATIG